MVGDRSDNVPDVLGGMAELTAGHASTQAKVRDGDSIVLELVREVVLALGHSTHEDADTLLGIERLDVVLDPHDGSFER